MCSSDLVDDISMPEVTRHYQTIDLCLFRESVLPGVSHGYRSEERRVGKECRSRW